MKKPDYKFKVREVLHFNSSKRYLVYYNAMTPQEVCWCSSRLSATNIAMLLNRQLSQSECFVFTCEELSACEEETK